MRVALVNPAWNYDGSIYFGCREPHLPLELGFCRALLEAEGHEVLLVDAQLEGIDHAEVRRRVEEHGAELTVLTTAPTYLFWRCPPPELRVPKEALAALDGVGGHKVVVGPHASTSPVSTLKKLGVDAAVLGECEEVVARLASTPRGQWEELPSLAVRADGHVQVNGGPHTTDLDRLPPLSWSHELLARHTHHHHRFDGELPGLGAEVEASRGCPYKCTFCAKETHRDKYRRRPLDRVVRELDGLVARGVEYVYFIDEIFLPNRELLEAIEARPLKFGVQTRIDLWSFEMIDLLGAAGCVTIEAGVESVSREGRALLDKKCKLDNDALAARLIRAKRSVPFVQATLMESKVDDPEAIAAWRTELSEHGVWANEPVPLFPYPGSPDYTRLWGPPDELAWERAHDYYLGRYDRFSDVQQDARRFVRLPILEAGGREVRSG
jgi:B12-binding domain/radical SAM domain protein of rhizo-twelve system